MGEKVNATLLNIRLVASFYANYYRWKGPQSMRGYELHKYRGYIMTMSAVWRVNHIKELANAYR